MLIRGVSTLSKSAGCALELAQVVGFPPARIVKIVKIVGGREKHQLIEK
jgi:hypothetical protein